MMFDLFASLVGLIAVSAALNLRRGQRPISVALQPNCLLTRRPLIFVTGLRTPFYFTSYFNEAPSVLREHGYQVEILRLPWLSAGHRRRSFTEAFLRREAIWVLDEASAREFSDLLNSIPTEQVWVLSAEDSGRWSERLLEGLHRFALFALRPGLALRSAAPSLHFASDTARRSLVREAVFRAELEWREQHSE